MLGGSGAIALGIAGTDVHLEISDEACGVIAEVGATLLVAYAVETSWFIKTSKARGRERENWVGFVAGIGLCSVSGIALAIASIDLGSADFIEVLAAAWMVFSLGFLGILVALLPYVLYEWVHTEYPDE